VTKMTLRQLIHLRGHRRHAAAAAAAAPSVEDLQRLIERLTADRQQLRVDCASPEELERNRLAIARAQQDLSHALIARYLPHAA
jgi:hypothetical protein